MAVAAPAAGARETVRQKRERDQELLVWPDLVFVEFICTVLFTITFVALSTVVNAPLLNKANAGITPNPSKAPWYFMNLQELLLHMDPGLAGVIVPTLLLIGLMVIPYVDRNNEGQGTWFGTANAVRITMFSLVYSSLWITWLILWDNGSHVRVYERLPMLWGSDTRLEWPGQKEIPDWMPAQGAVQAMWDLIWLENRVAIRDTWQWSMPVPFQPGEGQHDGSLDWPQDFQNVPLPFNGTWILEWEDPEWMPGWLRRVYPYNTYLDIPEITVQFVVPILAMVGLPILMLVILNRLGWATTVRDYMVALFTGFILTYTALTIVGVAFRGENQDLVPFWKVPNLEHDNSIFREALPLPDYGLMEPGPGPHG